MRASVLFCDILLYFPFIFLFLHYFLKKTTTTTKTKISKSDKNDVLESKDKIWKFLIVFLFFNPALVLIDHGHFQYNNVSLSLLGLSIFFICSKNSYLIGSSLFVCSFCYKQISLYFSLVYFFYLFSICCFSKSKQNPKTTKFSFFWFLKLGFTVLGTILLIFSPILFSEVRKFDNFAEMKAKATKQLFQILHRMFPFYRGLFEDKVASFWCATSILIKWNNIFKREQLVRMRFMLLFFLFLICLKFLTKSKPKAQF